MRRKGGIMRLVAGVVAAFALLLWAADVPSVSERLAQHRNLGKAFYENPTTQPQAVVEFKKALDLTPNSSREKLNYGLALLRAGKVAEGIAQLKEVQQKDPKLPHTWFNLGVQFKKAGETELAITQFEQMAKLAPEEPIVHYQLGTLYRIQARVADARLQFESAAKLDPLLAAARFQLYNAYRQEGRPQDAARALAQFQRLKKLAEGAAIPEDVDWCTYAEIYDPPAAPLAKSVPAETAFEDRVLDSGAGMLAIDLNGTGDADLLVWGANGIKLYRHGVELVNDTGLANLSGVIFVAAGDFDNDGLMDLCILTEAGPALYRNTKGHFTPFAANLPRKRFERAVWIDYDHDYDLDLVLLGESAALFRNEGVAGFADHTTDFPFVSGSATETLKLRVALDSKAFDLAVFYRDRPPVLYRDQLGGRYVTQPFDGRLASATEVEADFNNDGKVDRGRIAADGKVH